VFFRSQSFSCDSRPDKIDYAVPTRPQNLLARRPERCCFLPCTRTFTSAIPKTPPLAIVWLDKSGLQECSAPYACTSKPSPFDICDVYGAQKPDRGGELSGRQSPQSVVHSRSWLIEYSGLHHGYQRERGPDHLLQNLHECGFLAHRYLSFGLLPGEWRSLHNFRFAVSVSVAAANSTSLFDRQLHGVNRLRQLARIRLLGGA